MASPWRYALAVCLAVAPPVAISLWPLPAPAQAPAGHSGHPAHTPAAPPHAIETTLPTGVGAGTWDGALPAWPPGGRDLLVGTGQPYPALAAALDEARDGDRIVLVGGHHQGPVAVTRRLWLEGRQGAMVHGDGGTVMRVTAPGARVTGITIMGSGHSLDREDAGVRVEEAPGAVVAGCRMADVLFGVLAKQSPGLLIAGNDITGKDIDLGLAGDGIRVWHSDGARILANTARRTREIIVESTTAAAVEHNAVVNGRQGLHVMWAPGLRATGNFLSHNSNGIYVMYGAGAVITGNWVQQSRGPSGYGIGLKEADPALVNNNWLVGNRVGLYLDSSPLHPGDPGPITGNLVAYNDVGVLLTPATRGNRFSGNDFLDNLQQVGLTGGGGAPADNSWTADGHGNHWSDYAGYDTGGDGVGDLAHAPVRTFAGWMDRRPELRWFWLSPAASAVDAAARAFPLSAGAAWLVDERPAIFPAERRDPPWSCCRR